jgi:hypothetical protein
MDPGAQGRVEPAVGLGQRADRAAEVLELQLELEQVVVQRLGLPALQSVARVGELGIDRDRALVEPDQPPRQATRTL